MSGVEFIAGVLASIIAAFFWDKISSKIPISNKFGSVDVRGIWVGKIPYTYRRERQGYNIYRINEYKGNVKTHIEHYSKAKNGANQIVKLFGVGVFNDPVISIAYQFDKKYIKQSGVFIGRIQSIGMVGDIIHASYSQYIEDVNGSEVKTKLVNQEYVLYRVKLPIKNQIRVLFGMKYFSTVDDMEHFFNKELEKRDIENALLT